MATKKKNPKATKRSHPMPYVIVRCTAAGVHAGELVSIDGPHVLVRNARRLWEWRVPMGAGSFLSGVSQSGLGENCQIGVAVPEIHLLDACEVIPCTDVAAKSIKEYASNVRTK